MTYVLVKNQLGEFGILHRPLDKLVDFWDVKRDVFGVWSKDEDSARQAIARYIETDDLITKRNTWEIVE